MSILGKTLVDVAGEAAGAVAPFARKMGVNIEKQTFKASLKETTEIASRQLHTEFRRLTESGRSFLMKNGDSKTSQVLAQTMDAAEEEAKLMAGAYAKRWDDALDGIFGKGKYSVDDMYHISDVTEGLVKARSEKHALASLEWDKLMDEFSDMAFELDLKEIQGGVWNTVYKKMMKTPVAIEGGLGTRPRTHSEAAAIATKAARRSFTPRELYVPHYYTETAINDFLKDPVKVEKAIKAIMARGYTRDRDEAFEIVKMTVRQPGEFRGGPLQHTRELDEFLTGGYEKDLRKVGARYFYSASRRLKVAEKFGSKDELLNQKFLPQIAAEGGNAEIANNLYLAFADTADPKFREAARLTSTLHAITMLSTAGIVQPSQIANVIARAGWVNTVKGIISVVKDWKTERRFAEHTGAIIDSIWQDMAVESPSDFTKVWLRMIGLEHLDRINRVVAAVTGRFHSQQLAEQLVKGNLKGTKLQTVLRLLDKYGLGADQVYKQAGKLTPEQLRVAGYKLARNTQFATSVLDMPEFRTTPYGRFIYLFKSFAFQQSRFFKDEIGKEAKQGNWLPAINMYSAIMPMSLVLPNIVRGLKGRKEPEDPFWAAAENAAIVGTFGMMWDATRAINHGPSSIVNWAFGPTFSEATQLIGSDIAGIPRGIVREGEPDFEPFKKHLVRRAPFFGPLLYNLWWGEDQ